MRIWIDLDHTPHVPVFRPLLKELEKRGIEVVITARDFAQTIDMLKFWNIQHDAIGTHGGRNKFRKILNIVCRAFQLARYMRKNPVDLAVSHGSRSQVIAARMLGIPSIVMMDYEYNEAYIYNAFARALMVPALIPDERLKAGGYHLKKVIRYNGFKEELYLNDFKPDPAFRESIGIPDDVLLMTVRPPQMSANYHCPMSDEIMRQVIERGLAAENATVLAVCRDQDNIDYIRRHFGGKVRILEKSVDGLQLIWYSDLFLSGGGTMNREAALLGVPVYSIFASKKPYLDEYLAKQGKLTFIDDPSKVPNVQIEKRQISEQIQNSNDTISAGVVGQWLKVIESESLLLIP